MRLALRLALAFAFLSVLTTFGLGFVLRESRVVDETRRFDVDVRNACSRVADQIKRQAEADRRALGGACQKGDFVDRALLAMQSGEIDARRVALAAQLPEVRDSYGFEALVLLTGAGEVLAAEPRSLVKIPPGEARALLATPPENFLHGTKSISGIVARCRAEKEGQAAALVGVRVTENLLQSLAPADLEVHEGKGKSPSRDVAQATCAVSDAGGQRLAITVTKSKAELEKSLAKIDQTLLLASMVSAGAALLLGIVLARSLSRPLAELAEQAGKVGRGEAQPIVVRGTRETKELGHAFNRMLRDLEGTRRRLSAATRVAAWREVARRVAHEVKNPLAPIRAAVETLRRLRARQDPAFDEYFDEATRTVLDEVHRIANIVTEFTKYARLPPPRPKPEDVVELAERVVSLQRAVAGETLIEVRAAPSVPSVTCDADQVVQVLTNLVQNAIEAVKGLKSPRVFVEIELEGVDRVAITVKDNGPGVAAELAPRLFEPYATTKAHGTGLGLAIAQRIAVEHGGELAYVGEAGVGAAFRFVLPLAGPMLEGARDGGDLPSQIPSS